MGDLVIGQGEWQRKRGSPVPWRMENCHLDEVKTDPKGWNILSRPPLVEGSTVGSGPMRGAIHKAGLFNGDTFWVSGGHLYRNSTDLGAIDGSGIPIFAAGDSELLVTCGASAWSFNGVNLAAVATPGGWNVNSVHWMARRFVYARAGSGRYYWSALDDGRTVDALDFANAESEPDELLDIAKNGDVFALLGTNSIESWVLNGDPELPWTRVSQRTFGRGILRSGLKAEIPDTNSFYFISNDQLVCRMESAPVRVGDVALEEKIKLAASHKVFSFQFEGKPFVVIRAEGVGTYVLDISNNHQPSLYSTSGQTNWAISSAVTFEGEPYFGDDTDGSVWRFDPDSTTDSGNVEMPRYFTAGYPGTVSVSNVLAYGDNGSAQTETGEQGDPILEMSRVHGMASLPMGSHGRV
jgi:hypothetical protein